jgi:hypothetical protein
MIACVLDLDETLGRFNGDTFLLRPKLEFLLRYLRTSNIDIILWSLGGDEYVKWVVNTFLDDIKRYAYKIFASTECSRSERRFEFSKASDVIRATYAAGEELFLIGVDDKASQNMDSRYDLRISPKPYTKHDPTDRELVKVVETIVEALANMLDPSISRSSESVPCTSRFDSNVRH